MQTAALRKLLKGIGFVELAEHEGHVLVRSAKSQVVVPTLEPLKPATLSRIEGFSLLAREIAPPCDYPPQPRYEVKLESIDDDFWLATVPARPGCLTQAKTLSAAVERIRAALRLYDGETESIEVDVSIDLPVLKDGRAAIEAARGEIDAALERVEAARAKIGEAREKVDAALALVEEAKAGVAQAEAGVTVAQAGVGEAELALVERTRQVVERLMDAGFDAKDAALLLGKTTREVTRLLKSRPATASESTAPA